MPTLPAELWWDILRLAVHNPGLFETKWDYSPDFLIWTGWEWPRDHSVSLQTKLSICRVSRSWREIGFELLYEHLLFTDDDIVRFGALPKLVATLEQHADQSGYGRSTKRLDIHGNALKQPYFRSLLKLLNLCHHIHIFIVFNQSIFDGDGQSQLSSLLQKRFSHSLRRIDFHVVHPPLYRHVHFPNVPLDSLELPSGPLTMHPFPPFNSVSTLCVDLLCDFGDLLSACHFPALRHLTIRDITDRWGNSPSLQAFISVHGPRLQSLHLTVEYGDRNTFSLLPVLLSPAITLRSLAFSSIDMDWSPTEYIFPSITHIGLLTGPSPTPYEIEDIVSQPTFPGLECVRFLGYSNPWPVCKDRPYNDRWLSLLEVGHKRNIRFEDNQCELLEI